LHHQNALLILMNENALWQIDNSCGRTAGKNIKMPKRAILTNCSGFFLSVQQLMHFDQVLYFDLTNYSLQDQITFKLHFLKGMLSTTLLSDSGKRFSLKC
jgi:hypothetical protein